MVEFFASHFILFIVLIAVLAPLAGGSVIRFFLQAVVGILYPPKSAQIVRWQIATAGLIGLGALFFAAGFALFAFQCAWTWIGTAVAVGWSLMAGAGFIGWQIERHCRSDSP